MTKLLIALATTVALVGPALAVHDEDRLACLREANPIDTMAQMACWRRKEGPRMEKIQKETEDLTNRLRAQQAAEAEANRQRYAKEREMLIRKGPQKYNADPLHLMCEGSYNGGKRFDLDIIPREAKAVITNPDGTSSELPLYNLVMGYRRAVTPYGNVVPEHFIQAANINFNIYNDDGWPRIRYYEEGKGAEGQYSCNYYRQPLGG